MPVKIKYNVIPFSNKKTMNPTNRIISLFILKFFSLWAILLSMFLLFKMDFEYYTYLV